MDSARKALARHAWAEAYDLLRDADARGQLEARDLELLAESAWWTGHLPEAMDVRERAYGAATKGGDPVAAATAAINLGRDNLLRNDLPVATAWLNRAERVLEGVPENSGHGFLAACRAFGMALSGDTAGTLREASRAMEIAQRTGDPDLAAFAASEKGFALAVSGEIDAGLALLDDAIVAAVGGELEPSTAGGVCCTSIETSAALGEWSRAATWTEAQDRWCRREGINGYPGMCRLFRSEIKQFRGSWLEAEAEARQASVELEGYMPAATGTAFYRIAELRLLRGDLQGAEAALVRAHGLGTDPEPVMSLLALAQGRIQAAADGIREALEQPGRNLSWRAPPGSPLHRLPLLRAQVEIALAHGDVGTARAAADELASIGETFGGQNQIATALTADGMVLLAEGRAPDAARTGRRALEAWNGLTAPYEVAIARVALAEAHMATGALERAAMELQAARATFEHLGAAPALRRADERLAGLLSAGPTDASADATLERAVKTFAFTDIVDSTRLAELLGDDAWSKLIRWHDQTVRAVIAEHGGEEIKATGDGFFLAFADPDAAIDAMIAVQRRLAEHRERQGFAPAVRIGLHTAEANRAGLDYIGIGVNHAARIGAAAEAAEILVSAATLAAARRSDANAPRRTLRLKGIGEPVEVAAIGW
jgi:class 3 adenylate cyclase